ncbi:BA14K family protein [Rhodopseudomonas sp. P2A-2r]|uniref:BA14K family protein n=1 Tax=Rhodopseudomonas sp. P2A-2r TaxID=2991972 RepID=UPI00223460CB|nr:BA14K family protein [Rhodopseudomonas sp. P2A-2r]UZE46674.1 BA14K family protein [Rhodopseudomonas sp. P2A-2r]
MNLKLLSAVAVMALAIPALTPTASFAQVDKGGAVAGGGGPRVGGGGGGPRMGGGGGPQFHGGGGGPRFNGGGGPRYGGGYGGGGWHHRGGGGGFVPGLIAGGIIGGALAAPGGYYGNSYSYYGNGPYYGGPYDDGGEVVEVAPSGGDDVAYCMQTYKSYNPRTGTYLGYDGLRHACP